MKGEDIAERFLSPAVDIVKLADGLPRSEMGRHICRRILRSGTSAGANYEEARRGESSADFAHKLGICLNELRETHCWLKLVERAALVASIRSRVILQKAEKPYKIVGEINSHDWTKGRRKDMTDPLNESGGETTTGRRGQRIVSFSF